MKQLGFGSWNLKGGAINAVGVDGTSKSHFCSCLPCGVSFHHPIGALKVHAPTLIRKSGEFVPGGYQ